MVPDNLKVEVEVEEVVSDTNDTGDKHARHEIMHSECRHKKRHSAGNSKCAANSNQNEVHVAVMNSAACALEYVLSRNEIVNGNRNHECECGRYQVGDRQELSHDPEEYEIEREGRSANRCVPEEALV
ncbi:MAG: hypothetical protein QG636_430 [Patescibacteria group bacterium]|nr:hypothetical protein [Patescibacteria group bacterium]